MQPLFCYLGKVWWRLHVLLQQHAILCARKGLVKDQQIGATSMCSFCAESDGCDRHGHCQIVSDILVLEGIVIKIISVVLGRRDLINDTEKVVCSVPSASQSASSCQGHLCSRTFQSNQVRFALVQPLEFPAS